MAAFVTILLLSNVIGAGKRAVIDLPFIGAWPFGAGILFFPVSYVIGDVLTEVYGYARARRCIWAGFGAMLFMVVHGLGRRRAAARRRLDRAGGVRGGVRAGAAHRRSPSICAFWAGEFVNSYVLARMKMWTGGRASVDAHDRIDGGGAGGRQPDLLPARLLGRGGLDGGAGRLVLVTQWVLKVAGRCC